MTAGLRFLIAARRCEIAALAQLARTSELVDAIGQLVHALQRERGLSNLLLASGGRLFAAERAQQVERSQALEQAARGAFDQLAGAAGAGHGARLFSRIAWVLPGLDALPALRQRIATQALSAPQATAAYVKLIAGLLAVVFEAADGATDPDVSRALVALFNFMQGKEFAGQERACGAAAFAAGRNEPARQQQWLHLIESQERCFQVFADFAAPELRALWHTHQDAGELERLRRIGCAAAPDAPLDTSASARWFDACTRRIDEMQAVQEHLAADLRQCCRRKTAQASALLRADEALLASLAPAAADGEMAFFDAPDTPAATPYGRQLERSVLDMVQEQAQRLQAMSDELDTARAALNERKLVERAKGLLMAHHRLSEAAAHKMLRQSAMNQNRRLVDVAESVLAMAEFLPKGGTEA